MKRITAFLMILMLLCGLTACRGGQGEVPEPSPVLDAEETVTPEASAPPETESLLIGLVTDTGDYQAASAVAFAAEYVGSVGGRPIELMGNVDADPLDAARTLVEQVCCLISSVSGAEREELAAYADEAGIPLLFYQPVSAEILNDWTFAAGGTDEQLAAVMADYAYVELGYRQVYLLDMAGAESGVPAFQSAFEALGGSVIAQVEIPENADDLMPYLRAMNDPEAEAVAVRASTDRAGEFWQTWFDLGMSGTMDVLSLDQDGLTNAAALQALDSAVAEVARGTAAPASGPCDLSQENRELAQAWENAFDTPFTEASGAVQLLMLLDQAVQAEESDGSAQALRDALLRAEVTGPEGHTAFCGQNAAKRDLYVTEIVDGGAAETVRKYADQAPWNG